MMLIKLKSISSWCLADSELERISIELKKHFNTKTSSKAFGMAASNYVKLHDDYQVALDRIAELEGKMELLKVSIINKQKAEQSIINAI